ncbi:PGPGW domain-containing protein [Rubripirellula lacrimiformis]|uniref:PGPGW domain-containing protein n=1 Tax=Rubripirellula lacrimiformis TaxID=1930273 RepID=UPI001C54F890|nr:hypothetical protein [Rubripirellula lacrimiformis]
MTFLFTLVAIPWIAVRLPHDYFCSAKRRSAAPEDTIRWTIYVAILVAKNLLGATFLVLGIGMLVLPGQGLITILVGLSLMNFPGKFRVQKYLVSIPTVLRTLNWLRRRFGSPPFEIVAERR